ncbi:hypothetical protein AKG12_03430 [Agrobacterium sp. SUL3]|nr:hypothetical protein AKG12_03430 [Agrobacterium sp. SUL3]
MPLIAGTILSGSIGEVRIALEIQSFACSSMRAFSSGVIPPSALVFVRTIFNMLISLSLV